MLSCISQGIRIALITTVITAVSGDLIFGTCPPIINPSQLDLVAFLLPRDFPRPARPYYRRLPNGHAAHHVIPYSILRDFYNATINDAIATNNAENLSSFAFYLERMINYIVTGVHASTISLTHFFPEQHADAIAFLRGLQYYRFTTEELTSEAMQRGFLYVFSYFAWLPGNTFIGPSPDNRNDDPADSFETGAGPLVGQEQFNRLYSLHDMMYRFITHNNRPPFRQIVNMLQEVSNHTTFYSFDSTGWVFDQNGRLGIVSTTQNPYFYDGRWHDEINKRRAREVREGQISTATNTLFDDYGNDEFRERKKRSTAEVDFKMNDDGSCTGVYESRSFNTNDNNACKFIHDILVLIPGKAQFEIQNSGEVFTFSFKNTQAHSFTNKDGIPERYEISGKVANVKYYPTVSRCYVAIDDANYLYRNKYHYANNHQICSTAFYSFILGKEVIGNVLRDPTPDYANSLENLYVKNLCKTS